MHEGRRDAAAARSDAWSAMSLVHRRFIIAARQMVALERALSRLTFANAIHARCPRRASRSVCGGAWCAGVVRAVRVC